MRKLMLAAVAVAALAMTTNFATPASAQGVGARAAKNLTASNAQNAVTEVRWRRRHWRRRHWRGRHWGHPYWGYRHYGWGPAFGLGLGAGLLFGGLAASAQAQSAIDWCDARYRSYDRASQTYLGYDGYRHSCP